jgi:hypothetical protein
MSFGVRSELSGGVWMTCRREEHGPRSQSTSEVRSAGGTVDAVTPTESPTSADTHRLEDAVEEAGVAIWLDETADRQSCFPTVQQP